MNEKLRLLLRFIFSFKPFLQRIPQKGNRSLKCNASSASFIVIIICGVITKSIYLSFLCDLYWASNKLLAVNAAKWCTKHVLYGHGCNCDECIGKRRLVLVRLHYRSIAREQETGDFNQPGKYWLDSSSRWPNNQVDLYPRCSGQSARSGKEPLKGQIHRHWKIDNKFVTGNMISLPRSVFVLSNSKCQVRVLRADFVLGICTCLFAADCALFWVSFDAMCIVPSSL